MSNKRFPFQHLSLGVWDSFTYLESQMFHILSKQKSFRKWSSEKNPTPVGKSTRYHQIRKCLIIECNLSAKPREIFELSFRRGGMIIFFNGNNKRKSLTYRILMMNLSYGTFTYLSVLKRCWSQDYFFPLIFFKISFS